MPADDIAARTGLAPTTVNAIISGRVDRIYRDTSEAILALPLPPKGYKSKYDGLIDAIAGQRMLRALSARGFPLPVLAREVGVARETVGGIRLGARRHIRLSIDRAIVEAYNRLWNADPADFGVSPGDVKRAQGWAKSQGWPPPAAWDDEDLRDPEAKPKGCWGGAKAQKA
ncbi:hypothetical protein ACFW2V_14055 [Streptomyces sp. NPDC058947]|uniref:hypothetical protein n=1 Tax=Streptomyces sp. NPDC058947 TaxID=3346675 RepID=UPI003680E00E